MNPNLQFRQAVLPILIMALLHLIVQISLLARGTEYVAVSLTIDDTYYYLLTAWNAKVLGFVTFDGLHATNGVQLLWFAIIFLLATLVNSKVVLLFATLGVSFLLNALCYPIIAKIGLVLKQPALALLMAGFWAMQSLPFRIYSMGMENSLHALVFWLVVWQSLEFLLRIRIGNTPNFWGLTGVLILVVWTRLDSALIALVVFTFCMGMLIHTHRSNVRGFVQRYARTLAALSLLAVVGLLVQLIAFWLMGESFLPVSALVKTSGEVRGLSADAREKLVEVLLLGMPSIVQGRFSSHLLITLGMVAIGLVLGAQLTSSKRPVELRALLNLWSCLLVGELLYHAYVAVSGVQYSLYFAWYRSPSFIFWVITGSIIALLTFDQLQRFQPHWHGLKWAPVGLSLLSALAAVYLLARSVNFASTLYVARYRAALWIAENSPPDAVFAAWNTGQLGYFSNRTFINLDGVINSVDYYERVLRGPVSLSDYLFENNVDYIVDYAAYVAIPEYPVVRTFPLGDDSGRSIKIWQVSPQLSRPGNP